MMRLTLPNLVCVSVVLPWPSGGAIRCSRPCMRRTPPPQGVSRGENFSAKPPAQLFASDCTWAGCHKGPQGLGRKGPRHRRPRGLPAPALHQQPGKRRGAGKLSVRAAEWACAEAEREAEARRETCGGNGGGAFGPGELVRGQFGREPGEPCCKRARAPKRLRKKPETPPTQKSKEPRLLSRVQSRRPSTTAS